jgi:hypothetical protein
MRDIDSDRLEDAILASQKGVKNGDPGALQAFAKLIVTRARLNGYLSPQRVELSGKSGGPVEIKTVDDEELSKMLERLTREEAVEFLRLFNKAKGVSVEPSQPTAVRSEDDEEKK